MYADYTFNCVELFVCGLGVFGFCSSVSVCVWCKLRVADVRVCVYVSLCMCLILYSANQVTFP